MKKSMIIAGLGIAGIISLTYATSKQYNAPQDKPLTVVLDKYDGEYRNNPNIIDFQRRLPQMVNTAVARIERMFGKKEPGITVTVSLDDSFGSDTFIIPSAATGCPKTTYTRKQGNCSRYSIRLGSKAIAERYKGRTSIDKIVIHELTHIFMLYHVPNHDQLPDYIIEGVPIHIAGQEREIKSFQKQNKDKNVPFFFSPITEGPDNRWKYKDGEIHVDKYGEIIDKFNQYMMHHT